MSSLARRIILGTALAISGCASGMVVPADQDSTLRVLSRATLSAPADTQTTEHREPEAASEPTPAADTIRVTVEGPPDVEAPAEGAEIAAETSPPGRETPFADDEPQEAADQVIPPAPSDEPTDGAMITDAPDPTESDDKLTEDRPAVDPQPPAAPVVQSPRRANSEPMLTGEQETVVTPRPLPVSPFKSGGDEASLDRLNRQLTDVPVDLRPSEGEMPTNLAAGKLSGEPTIDETFPDDAPANIFCSYTPWTICYRPLYFEDIPLERYGCNVGYLQTGLSGVKFFGSIAALPYKMTVRPPRSCQCSNGFSRCGDCPLPGYGRRQIRWDASLVEAAAIAGVAFILP